MVEFLASSSVHECFMTFFQDLLIYCSIYYCVERYMKRYALLVETQQ